MNQSKLILLVMLGSVALLSNSESYALDFMPVADMRVASSKYLNFYASAKDQSSMKLRLANQIETHRADNGDSEEEAMSQILLLWGFVNERKFDQRERPVMIQFCYYYSTFMEHQYAVPKLMSDRMPPEKMRQLILWFNTQTEHTALEVVAAK